jgi:MFS family permease
VLGGLLVHAWGWRSILWVNVPLGLVILALGVVHLPPDTPHSESRVDVIGSMLFSLALGLLVYGFSRAATGLGQMLIGLALLGFVVFGGWELRAKHPNPGRCRGHPGSGRLRRTIMESIEILEKHGNSFSARGRRHSR